VAAKIVQLPASCAAPRRDQGEEMVEHARFSVAADAAVFFCDPHSPWQRGTNENTNAAAPPPAPAPTLPASPTTTSIRSPPNSTDGLDKSRG
jgi:hypothetical protein